MNTKPFDPHLKKNFGDRAEEVVLTFFRKKLGSENVKALPEGKYGPDFGFVSDTGTACYGDVERRSNWREGQDKFPFDTVHMPMRKLKFTKLGKPFYYVSVRSDLKKALMFGPRVIAEGKPIMLENRLNDSGPEEFLALQTALGIELDLGG